MRRRRWNGLRAQSPNAPKHEFDERLLDLRRALHHRHVTTGELFSKMDADRSGRITLSEFTNGLAMAGVAYDATDRELKVRRIITFSAEYTTHPPTPIFVLS